MPKFFNEKVAGHYLYFTSSCADNEEPAHVHASNARRLLEAGSAKFWVYYNGEVEIANKGILSENELNLISKFLRKHYRRIFEMWFSHFRNLKIYGHPYKHFVIEEAEILEQQQQHEANQHGSPKLSTF